ncbi:hypothetical protein LH425_08370 [Laribacter hongkongensis]|uniref:hypothetical protein n=1 Tax=Laribacter hongkongensis TaxID=168471 RepID=UPI001EFE63FE|nr:hypothetical protein [Laribacter hongkongensis]MCG9065056.1 hypothetical protein [Laribacter hongkongensis]
MISRIIRGSAIDCLSVETDTNPNGQPCIVLSHYFNMGDHRHAVTTACSMALTRDLIPGLIDALQAAYADTREDAPC